MHSLAYCMLIMFAPSVYYMCMCRCVACLCVYVRVYIVMCIQLLLCMYLSSHPSSLQLIMPCIV